MSRKKKKPDWQDDALAVARALKTGDVVVHSTDTVWGLAADAMSEAAISRVFDIKKRDKASTLLMLVDSPGMLEKYLPKLPEAAWDLLDVSDRPVTVIAKCSNDAKTKLAPGLVAMDGSLAVRCVKDDYLAFIIRGLGRPVASTSANLNGKETPRSYSEIDDAVTSAADFVAQHRRNAPTNGAPSMLVKFDEQDRITIIRS